MPPLYRILEICFYSLFTFLPYIIFALYPFRNHLRYGAPITGVLIVLVSGVQVGLGLCAGFFFHEKVGLISLISTLLYFSFYFIAVNDYFGKLLFTILMLSNISNFIVMLTKCIEGMLFPEIALEPYRWSFTLVMVFVQAIILVPLFFYIWRTIPVVFDKETAKPTWRYLWLIPATFYIIWYYQLYGNSNMSSLELALQVSTSVFLFFINIGAILIYHIVFNHVKVVDENIRLAERNHTLAMQNLQYENLQFKINEIRQAKHDIRHHISIMKGYVQTGEYGKLEEYLKTYQKSLPDDSTLVFCENTAVNILLLYFAQQAKNNDIDFAVNTHVPENCGIPENDLSVLLGNLLENALDACIAHKSAEKAIIVKARSKGDSIFFTIDNTYDGKVRQDRQGNYLSTKKNGSSLGLASVKSIVERYKGYSTINHENGMFRVSILLNCPVIYTEE